MELPIICLLLGVLSLQHTFVTGKRDKVLLTDIKTLTLYRGQITNARRTSPILQLRCVGGTAGCSSFTAQVIQCTNKGTDGYDMQWECKTDMDKDFRFGPVTVKCEGYEYPDDPYVLLGSCGLEYTLDLTKVPSVWSRLCDLVGMVIKVAFVGLIIFGAIMACADPAHRSSTEGYKGGFPSIKGGFPTGGGSSCGTRTASGFGGTMRR